MLKSVTLKRVQIALQMATQAITTQEQQLVEKVVGDGAKGEAQSFAERSQSIIMLAALMLEEDDRQSRSVIIPAHG